MAKTVNEATLRIRAQNLATKDLREVSKELDNVTESQKQNTTASGLAAREMRELKDELNGLKTLAAGIAKRGAIAEGLKKDKTEIGNTQRRIADLRESLERLNNTKASGQKVKGLGAEIRKVQRQLTAAEKQLENQVTKFNESAKAAATLGISSKRTAESIAKINVEAERTATLIREAERAVEQHNDALKLTRAALREQQQLQREITAEAQKRNAAEAAAAKAFRDRARQLSADLDRIAKKRADSIAAFSDPGFKPFQTPTIGPTRDVGKEALAREAAFRERLVNVLRRQKDGGEKLLSTEHKLAAAAKKTAAALDQQSRSLDRNNKLGGIFADTGRKSLSVYQRMRGQLLSIAAAYVGIFQAVNLVRSAIDVQQQRQGLSIQLKVANNDDAVRAASDMKFLREEADRLGLVFEDLAKNFANYKISATAAGASNATVRRTFVQAAEVVTAMRLSVDDAEGVFRAFTQILGKSRVQAEELRGQLGDRLPGAVAEFAKSLVAAGKIANANQLDEYLKKGKAGVQDFFNFLKAYNDKVRNSIEESSNTLFSQFNRLTNAYRDFLSDFANAGTAKELRDVVDELILKLKGPEGKKFAQELAGAFALVARAILVVIEHFDTFIVVLKAFLALQAVKAFVGLASAVLVSGSRLLSAAKAMKNFAVATALAKGGVGTLTIGMRVLLAMLGPIGIGLGLVAAAFGASYRASMKAAQGVEEYNNKLRQMDALEGKQLAGAIRARADDVRRLNTEIKDTAYKLEKARKNRDTTLLGGVNEAVERAADSMREEGQSAQSLTEKLRLLQQQREAAVAAAVLGAKRLRKEADAARKLADEDAKSRDNFTLPVEDAEKAKKDNSEAELRRLEALAERRRDIADRAAKELLDIEKEFSDARLGMEATTQEQLDANLRERLAIVDAEMRKKRLELEGLKRDAENIKSAEGVDFAQKALDQLPALQAVQESQLRTQAILDSIALKEKHINDLISERDAKIALINTQVELGLESELDGREKAIALQLQYKNAIQGSVAALIAQLEALKASNPDLVAMLNVDELIAKLRQSSAEAGKVLTTLELVGQNLGGEFSAGVASAFGTLIKGLAGGIEGVNSIADAFKNAKNSFLNFLADFLVGIGQAILQAILLKAIMNAIRGTSGGYTDAAIGALTGHTGGVVRSTGIGSGNPTRQVSAALFAGAQRFHEGGLPGLKTNEVPAILKKREEVLTEDDPRNVLNGGLQPGGGRTEVSIVNAIDSASVFEAGANSPAGRQVIYNMIRANKAGFKKLLQ